MPSMKTLKKTFLHGHRFHSRWVPPHRENTCIFISAGTAPNVPNWQEHGAACKRVCCSNYVILALVI